MRAVRCFAHRDLPAKAVQKYHLRHCLGDLGDAHSSKRLAFGLYGRLHSLAPLSRHQSRQQSAMAFRLWPANQASAHGCLGAIRKGSCRAARLLEMKWWCRLSTSRQACPCGPRGSLQS